MMTAQEKISLTILLLKAEGLTTEQAFNIVLGKGSYQKLVDELYTELRAKAGL